MEFSCQHYPLSDEFAAVKTFAATFITGIELVIDGGLTAR